ncbi:MAG: hydrogenase maturation protein [Acidobacteria bacterium]|nr:hydrogenase maturation protein [Acidobacteriota bacterium]
MRILLLTHTFNSLCQRFFVELAGRGHEVSVELDINDRVSEEAVRLFDPELIVAPYLKRAIPERVWRDRVCLVVHPGIVGDRGPSALDWAILDGEEEWGVTLLQANAEMDAGDVWASRRFTMRSATKSSLYRNEVTEAAVDALIEAVGKQAGGGFRPAPLSSLPARGRPRPPMRQVDRRIDWARDSTEMVLRKIRASDGSPGVIDNVLGEEMYLFDAEEERELRGRPGEIIAANEVGGGIGGGICRATDDGAVWISQIRMKAAGDELPLKLPAAMLLRERLNGIPEARGSRLHEIRYEERDGIGYLHFPFYNGAMSTTHCVKLRSAFLQASAGGARVLVLMGGPDFWSNGIDLNVIEAAGSAAEESWRNIEAMNDLARAIITATGLVTISALQGNAGAGGVFLALAADRVYARSGVVLNPHYKAMGNLYGSEYWTYLLPRRVGEAMAMELTELRLPIGAAAAKTMGLIDDHFGRDVPEFRRRVEEIATGLAHDPDLDRTLREKAMRRQADELRKPLEAYRVDEMKHMRLNFFGLDPSYHVARYNFVHRVPHSRTPFHLAKHRLPGWGRRS